jgi:hypothetical protein
MKIIIKKINFEELNVLKEQRETLRKSFQVFKAMLAIRGVGERKS